MKIVSYNIHRGYGTDRKYDLDRIAIVLEQLRADCDRFMQAAMVSTPRDLRGAVAQVLGLLTYPGLRRPCRSP